MEKHVGTAKRSVIIRASVETVWKKLSKITKLDWLEEQKSSKFLSQKKYGVGAIRLISFEDGSDVEEHIVEWSTKKGFFLHCNYRVAIACVFSNHLNEKYKRW